MWLEAVERHVPGNADDPVLLVRDWDGATLRLIWVDFTTIVSLIREPDVGIFFAPVEPIGNVPSRAQGPPRRSVQILYSRTELNELRVMAKRVADRGGENRILKRGAMLHADTAMLAPAESTRPRRFAQPGPSAITLRFTDGQEAGLDEAASHWEMGRRLLDKIRTKGAKDLRPDPGADETARLWYLAGAAHMQRIQNLHPWHVERSVQLFPQDPEILFFAACLHEALSGPQFQMAMQSASVPRDVHFDIGSEGAELRDAERLFRQSLERNPMRIETRIRLGRVLGRRGRHEEAARVLRQALTATENRLLLYYGNMFLGAEAEALGRADEARQAYGRAAALYSLAQSPRLALSALATRAGDRTSALRTIESVLNRDDVDQADDPWWSYYISQARGTDALLDALHQRIQEEDGR
jgi:tetratricopeptide (TPR) repeat protein